jgi:hypothetical protein
MSSAHAALVEHQVPLGGGFQVGRQPIVVTAREHRFEQPGTDALSLVARAHAERLEVPSGPAFPRGFLRN